MNKKFNILFLCLIMVVSLVIVSSGKAFAKPCKMNSQSVHCLESKMNCCEKCKTDCSCCKDNKIDCKQCCEKTKDCCKDCCKNCSNDCCSKDMTSEGKDNCNDCKSHNTNCEMKTSDKKINK